jgi:multimeric flavodoxin WrbA
MRKGNTYALTNEITNRLALKPDVEITEISVAQLGVPFCTSCHLCLNKGEEYCPHDRYLQSVRAALLDCDGLVLSGTTYVRALNGAMKNLIDHFAYLFHRPALFGKQGMIIATSAGVGEQGVAKYLKNVIGQWGINGAMIITRNTKQERLQSFGGLPSKKTVKQYDDASEHFYERPAMKSQ